MRLFLFVLLAALRRLVEWVENGAAPPASQCIPRGGVLADNPFVDGQPERRATLLVP